MDFFAREFPSKMVQDASDKRSKRGVILLGDFLLKSNCNEKGGFSGSSKPSFFFLTKSMKYDKKEAENTIERERQVVDKLENESCLWLGI